MALSINPDSITALVISLPNRKDRRDFFSEQAEKQGIKYEFVDGVIRDRPARGINEAHRNCVKLAKARGWEYVLIMEDDVLFPVEGSYNYFLDNVPEENWDIYLAGVYSGSDNISRRVKNFSGLHCYLVHNRFYGKFLLTNPNRHIDIALGGQGKYFVCKPFAAIQINGFSDNVRKTVNYDTFVRGKYLTEPYYGRNNNNVDT